MADRTINIDGVIYQVTANGLTTRLGTVAEIERGRGGDRLFVRHVNDGLTNATTAATTTAHALPSWIWLAGAAALYFLIGQKKGR